MSRRSISRTFFKHVVLLHIEYSVLIGLNPVTRRPDIQSLILHPPKNLFRFTAVNSFDFFPNLSSDVAIHSCCKLVKQTDPRKTGSKDARPTAYTFVDLVYNNYKCVMMFEVRICHFFTHVASYGT